MLIHLQRQVPPLIPSVMMWVTGGWMDGQIDRIIACPSIVCCVLSSMLCVLLRQFNSPEGMSRFVYYHHYHLIGGRGLVSCVAATTTAVHVVRPKNVFAIAAIDYLKNPRTRRLLNLDSHTVTSQSLCPTFGIGIETHTLQTTALLLLLLLLLTGSLFIIPSNLLLFCCIFN